jgi:hypothetical protein
MSELLTVREVANILKCSTEFVRRTFAKRGADLGTPEDVKRHTGQRRMLRIPRATLEKYLTAKAGHPVTVKLPEPQPKISDGDLATRIADAMLKRQEEIEEQEWQEECYQELENERHRRS